MSKYSHIEFYRFIIYTSTVSPNDIASKAVKQINVNVLKCANNMKKLLTICKKNSKIHSLLKIINININIFIINLSNKIR